MEKRLTVPDLSLLAHVQQLCDTWAPYESSPELERCFDQAMKEIISWHQQKNSYYRSLCEKEQGANPYGPMTPATFFKFHEELSIEKEQVALHLTSSGTTGQKSQIFFDEWTISSAQRMVDAIFDFYGWNTPEQEVNYLLYTYAPEEGSKLGTAYTDNFLCKYAKINQVEYALKYLGSDIGHRFDLPGVIARLVDFERQGLPVRIFGFPAFLSFTLEALPKILGRPLKLHPESLVFLGGGWKGNQDKAISKEELYQKATELLGIPDERLRDGFGSVEHCIPYVECKHHRFHIPIWSKVFVRDVKTLAEVENGEIGYLNFVSPYITSVPAHNVLMTDLVRKVSSKNCGCGLKTDAFEVIGRAGLSSSKSCAVAASDLLSEFNS